MRVEQWPEKALGQRDTRAGCWRSGWRGAGDTEMVRPWGMWELPGDHVAGVGLEWVETRGRETC